MKKLAILDDYQNVALKMADWSRLKGKVDVTVFTDHLDDVDAVAKRLAAFEIVCLMRERTPFKRDLFKKLPNLKLLVTTGARNLSIDVAAGNECGVTVCHTTNPASAPQMIQFTWGLILSAVRHIPVEERNMRTGGWQTTLGTTLHDKTLGLIGLGKIGAGVAKVGQAFGMKTIAWSQNMTAEKAAAAGCKLVGKDELFQTADIISVHLVLSDRTRGVVGARELGLMKPTAYFVNTSRGPLADEKALVSVLQARKIAGAALDVYDQEPLPKDHPFRKLDNAVVTPHVGFVTEETYRIGYTDTVEDVLAWLDGKPIRILKPGAGE
jgi:phosphoglycerate dehydrogenase-like enzyme